MRLLLPLPAFAVVFVACGGSVEPVASDGQGQQAQSAQSGSSPTTSDECKLGERRNCGNDSSSVEECVEDEDGRNVWNQCHANGSSSTPLVVVFDGAPVTFGDARGATFDLAGDGASHGTSWPTARTPWLALDRDGNGRIDDGSELFGSMTRLATGVRAKNGFEALAELDSNHDGAITSDDASFAKLVLWSDADADRTSSASEQTPASERIVRIELGYRIDPRCTAKGDCEIERAKIVYRDRDGEERAGEIVDVHLRHR